MSVNDSGRYYNLAKKAFAETESGLIKYRTLPPGNFFPQDQANIDFNRARSAVYDSACICQVFSAVFVEASINQIGELGLGANYFYSHLDKLDPKSKLLVVMRLLDGEEIDKGGSYYQGLVTLFRVRNEILHHKTLPDEKHTLDPTIPYGLAKICFDTARTTGQRIVGRNRHPIIYCSEKYEYDHKI